MSTPSVPMASPGPCAISTDGRRSSFSVGGVQARSQRGGRACRRQRLSMFQRRLDNGIMPVVVLDSTKGWQSVSVCSCLIVHERSCDV